MKTGITCIITLIISIVFWGTLANATPEMDVASPELELEIHRPYPPEPRGKKYCDVWVTATQLLPRNETRPDVEIDEFKSPVGKESEIKQELIDLISVHKVTENFYILAKVEEKEIVEYRYTYFEGCKWVTEGPEKPDKS